VTSASLRGDLSQGRERLCSNNLSAVTESEEERKESDSFTKGHRLASSVPPSPANSGSLGARLLTEEASSASSRQKPLLLWSASENEDL
jgi:hypothetical protein